MYSKRSQDWTPPLKPQKAKYLHSAATMKILTMFARALHTSPHPYMCLQTRAWKWKHNKKWWRKTCQSIWHDVSQTFSCLHEIPSYMTYVKSSDFIKPPEEFFQKTPQQIPPSLRLAVEKVQVIETTVVTSARAVECTGAVRRHGGRWHWGRGCRCSRRKRTFHRPRRSIPMCGRSALWAAFRSGTAESSDWPGERCFEGTSKPLTRNRLNPIFYKTQLATWPQFIQIYCFSSFLTSPSSLRWVEMHLAMKRL